MRNILRVMRERRSHRIQFDGKRPISELELTQILEAARWSPTAHNMQNFEIVVVDDRAVIDAVGRIRVETSEAFIRENYQQLSFSEAELKSKGTGLLASMFLPAWRKADTNPAVVIDFERAFLGGAIDNAPMLLVVLYDSRKRAPASEGDVLGFMSLGCVMQNIWLAAESLGIGMQILSAFSCDNVENELRKVLAVPPHLKVGFACRLGHPAASKKHRYLRVRRGVEAFTHRNRYGTSLTAAETARNLIS